MNFLSFIFGIIATLAAEGIMLLVAVYASFWREEQKIAEREVLRKTKDAGYGDDYHRNTDDQADR